MKKKHLIIIAIILITAIFFAFTRSSYFCLQYIRLSGQAKNDLRFQEFLGKNIFSVNKQMIMSKLRSPRIYDCQIKKVWPNAIRITPILRKDFMLLKTSNYYTPLSKEKIVMKFQKYSPVPIINVELPPYSIGDTIQNPQINQIYNLYLLILEKDPNFAKLISEFFYQDGKLYFLKSSPINFVCLGTSDVLGKIKKLKSLEKSIDLAGKMIDLSYDNQLIYKEADR